MLKFLCVKINVTDMSGNVPWTYLITIVMVLYFFQYFPLAGACPNYLRRANNSDRFNPVFNIRTTTLNS